LPAATNDPYVDRHLLPGVPTPILPDDIVNKAYADAAAGAKPRGIFTVMFDNETSVADRFYILDDTGQLSGGTEANRQQVFPFAITIIRAIARISTNTKAAIQNIILRDDGADATILPIPSSDTGQIDSGVISDAIAVDSLLNIKVEFSAAGAWYGMAYFIFEYD